MGMKVMSRISRKFSNSADTTFCTFICDMTWAYYTEKAGFCFRIGSFFHFLYPSFSLFSFSISCFQCSIVFYGRFKGVSV